MGGCACCEKNGFWKAPTFEPCSGTGVGAALPSGSLSTDTFSKLTGDTKSGAVLSSAATSLLEMMQSDPAGAADAATNFVFGAVETAVAVAAPTGIGAVFAVALGFLKGAMSARNPAIVVDPMDQALLETPSGGEYCDPEKGGAACGNLLAFVRLGYFGKSALAQEKQSPYINRPSFRTDIVSERTGLTVRDLIRRWLLVARPDLLTGPQDVREWGHSLAYFYTVVPWNTYRGDGIAGIRYPPKSTDVMDLAYDPPIDLFQDDGLVTSSLSMGMQVALSLAQQGAWSRFGPFNADVVHLRDETRQQYDDRGATFYGKWPLSGRFGKQHALPYNMVIQACVEEWVKAKAIYDHAAAETRASSAPSHLLAAHVQQSVFLARAGGKHGGSILDAIQHPKLKIKPIEAAAGLGLAALLFL